ncbi:MAG: hypothetical protein R2726_02425 [Acidimicrobiales bacterium]
MLDELAERVDRHLEATPQRGQRLPPPPGRARFGQHPVDEPGHRGEIAAVRDPSGEGGAGQHARALPAEDQAGGDAGACGEQRGVQPHRHQRPRAGHDPDRPLRREVPAHHLDPCRQVGRELVERGPGDGLVVLARGVG